jgi:hypothetical protein
MDVLVRDRDTLIGRIAAELDKPSVYMGGPSKRSLRLAEAVVRITDDHYRGAVEDRDKLAAYLRWRLNPQQGPPPLTYAEVLDFIGRFGGQYEAE